MYVPISFLSDIFENSLNQFELLGDFKIFLFVESLILAHWQAIHKFKTFMVIVKICRGPLDQISINGQI